MFARQHGNTQPIHVCAITHRQRIQDARTRLLNALLAPANTPSLPPKDIDTLVDILTTSTQPFNPRDIGEGPWQVLYSRGPLLWKALTAPGRVVNPTNEFSQAFDAQQGTVVNKGELFGERLYVTARGQFTVMVCGGGGVVRLCSWCLAGV